MTRHPFPRPGSGGLTKLLLVLCILVLALFIWGLWPEATERSGAGGAQDSARQGSHGEGVEVRPDAPRVIEQSRVHEPAPRSTLADKLNDPRGSIGRDLRILADLLDNYRQALGSVPSGNSREIVSALSGRNIRGHAVLPADHPALSREGELLDRWGRPFIFHPVSRSVIEIRSSGPDGEIYTGDDSVVSTGPRPDWLRS